MSDQPEKLDLASASISDAQRAKLRELFPEVFTEGGKIDFERLKRSLGETVDAGKERFGLTWPGKVDCFKTIQQPSTATLRPVRGESVNFDTTGNLVIEGDNLEVLKLLQKSYLGKVKMIYIDPPYNTGNDFIYPDNYAESLDTYLRYTGQVDDEGRKYSANTEADGRFHSKWLSMMYPRLFLARNLLRDDGIIFISINDAELSNLLSLCNEIFGEANHIATFIWVNEGNIDNQSRIKVNQEYIVAFAKDEKHVGPPPVVDPNIPKSSKIFREEIENTVVQNGPANPISSVLIPPGFPADFAEGKIEPKEDFWPKLNETVKIVSGKTLNTFSATSGWKCKGLLEEFIGNNFNPIVDGKGQETVFYITKTGALFYKKRRLENPSHVLTVLRGMGTVQAASSKLASLNIEFSYPKPTELIEYLTRVGTSDGDIILDFFAGSGTTGEAVLNLNRDIGSRKFILVQLPEALQRSRFANIAELCRERLRGVVKRLNDDDSGKLALGNSARADRGFKVFKLYSSNFKAWNANVTKEPAALAQQLEMHVNHIVEERSPEDLLFEILLKSGFPLSTSVEVLNLAGKSVYSVEQGAMLVCLESELTPAVIQAVADRQPVRVICLDAGFAGNDQLKTNAVQQMRARGVTKFQTV